LTDFHIRKAGAMDAANICDLLNDIIAKGGTTAMVQPVTGAQIEIWMTTEDAVWHVAEDDRGNLLGFQWIEPHADLPKDATDIASFVKIGKTGLGIGSALFEVTKTAARDMGYRKIDAIIRADNASGLVYYQSRGFETIGHLPNTELEDGTSVDKIWKRYDL
jgi:L-amino acid N-acyltransferase YncA